MTESRRRLGQPLLALLVLLASTFPLASAETEPPFTSAAASGTLGSNGWFRASPVTVSFTAIDNGSGVDQTYRRVGANPFAAGGSLSVTSDGTSVVEFYSTDLDGNAESPRSITVRLDTRDPRATITNPPGSVIDPSSPTVRRYNAGVSIAVNYQDFPGGSGLHNRSYFLTKNGVTGPWTGYTVPVSVTDEGLYTFTAVAFDVAGREGRASLQFAIDATAPSLTLAVVPDVAAGAVGLRVTGSETLAASPAPFVDATGPSCSPCTVSLTRSSALGWTGVFAPPAAGTYTLDATARDITGNVGTVSRALATDPSGAAPLSITPAPGSIVPSSRSTVSATFDAPVVATAVLLDGGFSPVAAGAPATTVSAPLGFQNTGLHVVGLSVTAGAHERTVAANYLISPEQPSVLGVDAPDVVPANAIVRAYANVSVQGAGLASVTIDSVPARWLRDSLWVADVGPYAQGNLVSFDAVATTLAGITVNFDGPDRTIGAPGAGVASGIRSGTLTWDGRHLLVSSASGPSGAGTLAGRVLVAPDGGAATWITGVSTAQGGGTNVAFDLAAMPAGLVDVKSLWINDTAAGLSAALAPVKVLRARAISPTLVDLTLPVDPPQGPVRVTANVTGADRARLAWNLSEPLGTPAMARLAEPTASTKTGDTLSVTFDLNVGPGVFWARLEAFDAQNGRVLSPSKATRVLDTRSPSLGALFPASGRTVEEKRPAIGLAWSDPSGVDLSSVIVQVNGITVPSSSLSVTSTGFTHTPAADLDGSVSVAVDAKDALGTLAHVDWTFTVGATSGSTTNLGLPAPCAAQDQVGTGSEVKCPEATGSKNSTGSAFDTTPPEIVSHGPLGLVRDATPTLALRYRDAASAILPSAVLVDLDGRRLAIDAGAEAASAMLFDLAPGRHEISATVDDARGNRARLSWSFWYAPPGAAYAATGGPLEVPGIGVLDARGARNATLVATREGATIRLAGAADGGLTSVRVVAAEGFLVAPEPLVEDLDLALPATLQVLDAVSSAPALAFEADLDSSGKSIRAVVAGHGLGPPALRLLLGEVPTLWPSAPAIRELGRDGIETRYAIDLGELTDGVWRLEARVVDAWGRERAVNTTFTIDASGPSTSVAYKPGLGAVEVLARDKGAGVRSIRLLIDGVERGNRTFERDGEEAKVLSVSLGGALPTGNHTVLVEATDFDGNVGRVSTWFDVPAPAPTTQRIPQPVAFVLAGLALAAMALRRR